MSLTGAIGIVIFFLGAYLLWQSRREVVFWSAEFFRILRGEFSRHREPGSVDPSLRVKPFAARSRRAGAFRLASGFALLMLGPLLILLDLVLE